MVVLLLYEFENPQGFLLSDGIHVPQHKEGM